MILTVNNSGLVIATGKDIRQYDGYATVDNRKYYNVGADTHSIIDLDLPYGMPGYWRHTNGSLELTEAGVIYTQHKQEEEAIAYANSVSDGLKAYLDKVAQDHRYEDIKSARSYAGFTNAFQAEATALGQWASEVWIYAGQVEAEVMAGARTPPTLDELIAELPPLVMP